MKSRRTRLRAFAMIQAMVLIAFSVSYTGLSNEAAITLSPDATGRANRSVVEVARREPLQIGPLYDNPQVVSDEELAAVLKQIRPKFSRDELKPNSVEHALRTWGVDTTFQDSDVMSGVELRDFLIDHGRFVSSWNAETAPLLVDRPQGISIRWDRRAEGSVHHDHWLASLTEAGVGLDVPVYGPARRNMTVNDVLQEALRDFRLDEREIE